MHRLEESEAQREERLAAGCEDLKEFFAALAAKLECGLDDFCAFKIPPYTKQHAGTRLRARGDAKLDLNRDIYEQMKLSGAHYNIGLEVPPRLVIIDADQKEWKEKTGLDDLERHYIELGLTWPPTTAYETTASGGAHLFYVVSHEAAKNIWDKTDGYSKGIDIIARYGAGKGCGEAIELNKEDKEIHPRFIVISPSYVDYMKERDKVQHADAYEFQSNPSNIEDLPLALEQYIIEKLSSKRGKKETVSFYDNTKSYKYVSAQEEGYSKDIAVESAIDYLSNHSPRASDGNTHHTLACVLTATHIRCGIDIETARDLMHTHYRARCLPEWDLWEYENSGKLQSATRIVNPADRPLSHLKKYLADKKRKILDETVNDIAKKEGKRVLLAADPVIADAFISVQEHIIADQEVEHNGVRAPRILYMYNSENGIYEELTHESLIAKVKTFLKTIQLVRDSGTKREASHTLYSSVAHTIAATEALHTQDFFREEKIRDKYHCVFNDCVVSLNRDGTLDVSKEFSKDYKQRSRHNYDIHDYLIEECEQRPLMHKVLADALAGSREQVKKYEALQEFVGACLFGAATAAKTAFFLYGETAKNGKSTFVNGALSIMSGVSSNVPMHLMSPEKFFGEKLVASKLNAINEIDNSAAKVKEIDVSTIKETFSGDAVTTINTKNQPVRRVKLIAGHLFSSNQQPVVRGFDKGVARRVCIIEFPNRISEHDEIIDMEAKIAAQVAINAVWAIRGAQRLIARGFRYEYTSDEEHRAMELSSGDVAMWAEEFLMQREAVTAYKIRTNELHAEYLKWANTSRISIQSFVQELKRAGFKHTNKHPSGFYCAKRETLTEYDTEQQSRLAIVKAIY